MSDPRIGEHLIFEIEQVPGQEDISIQDQSQAKTYSVNSTKSVPAQVPKVENEVFEVDLPDEE